MAIFNALPSVLWIVQGTITVLLPLIASPHLPLLLTLDKNLYTSLRVYILYILLGATCYQWQLQVTLAKGTNSEVSVPLQVTYFLLVKFFITNCSYKLCSCFEQIILNNPYYLHLMQVFLQKEY